MDQGEGRRLEGIERALLAIGEYVAFEGRSGSHYEELRGRLIEELDRLRAAVGAVPTTAPRGRHGSEAPGQDLGVPAASGGDAVDPVPPNMPSTYLPRVPQDAQDR